ncbi:MAG: hypothetical protein OEZ38_10345, partial [Gammaproteobacteria bacterium]|nr:hypothetical protein [Gammaproteobacteria bacterium]
TLILLTTVITMLGSSACSMNNQLKENNISIKRLDSKEAQITQTYLNVADNRLILRGQIKQKLHNRGPIPGHLHITLIDPNGQALMETDIGYLRNNVQSSTAKFSTEIPVHLSSGSTIKIAHFTTKNHTVDSGKTTWKTLNN